VAACDASHRNREKEDTERRPHASSLAQREVRQRSMAPDATILHFQKNCLMTLKVHKIENFFDSDFEICVISLLVMPKL
jgi:hypothetical protein